MIWNIWNVLYPIVLYYVVSGFAFFGMTILFGELPEIYMIKQLVSSAVTIPFLLSLLKQERYIHEVVYGKQEKRPFGVKLLIGILLATGTACIGMAINNCIAMTPLVELSIGFKQANESFFSGAILIRILASCVIVPIAEEVLFRGVVFSRVVKMTDLRWGIFFSAVLFGIVHVNLVQILYATLLGVVLAAIVVMTKRVSYAVLAHGITNLAAIIRAETGFLEFSYHFNFAGIAFTCLLLLTGAGVLAFVFHQNRKNEETS